MLCQITHQAFHSHRQWAVLLILLACCVACARQTPQTPTPTAPFDQRFHLLLNVAVGGSWPGFPDDTTEFPQFMYVDYVRAYQKEE